MLNEQQWLDHALYVNGDWGNKMEVTLKQKLAKLCEGIGLVKKIPRIKTTGDWASRGQLANPDLPENGHQMSAWECSVNVKK